MLYGSAYYDNSILSGLVLGMSVNNLLTQRSVVNLNSFVGQYYRFELDYLQFIDRNQKLGLSPSFYADNTLLPMLELRGEYGSVIGRNFTTGLSVNRRLGMNQMMSVSANYEYMNLILHYVSNSHLKNLSYNYMSATYDYLVNTLDTKQFPDRGMIFNISFSTSKLLSGGIRTDSSKVVFNEKMNGEFSFDRFFTLYGNIKRYFSFTDKLTFAIGADALFITDSDSVSSQNIFIFLVVLNPLVKDQFR